MLKSITPRQLAEQLASADATPMQLLDVREPWELDICVLPGVIAIPMQEIPQRINELVASVPTVCICHHGGRSLEVARYLVQHGVEDVINLDGGMDAWARTVDSGVAVY